MHATCATNRILLDLITLIIFGEEHTSSCCTVHCFRQHTINFSSVVSDRTEQKTKNKRNAISVPEPLTVLLLCLPQSWSDFWCRCSMQL